MNKDRTDKSLAEGIRSILRSVPALQGVRNNLLGIESQWAHVPTNAKGADELLDACQRRAEARYTSLTGQKVKPLTLTSEDLDGLLKAIGLLARAVGLPADTEVARTSREYRIWTDNLENYDTITGHEGKYIAAGFVPPKRYAARRGLKLNDAAELIARRSIRGGRNRKRAIAAQDNR